MLTLLIDNQQAIIKAGTTFKITRVNPYFDTTGDYTFEVTLPLRHCPANRAIFGTPDLPQSRHIPLLGQRHTMQLIAPPLALRGTATITSVTESDIRVQLIAGTGALINTLTDDDNTTQYIDQMDLGNAWDSFPPTVAYVIGDNHEICRPGIDLATQIKIFKAMPTTPALDSLTMAFGTSDQTDAVIFPVCASDDEHYKLYNAIDFSQDRPHLATYINEILVDVKVNGKGENPEDFIYTTTKTDVTTLSPQPYLLDILQRIIRATGYTIGDWSAYTTNPLTAGLYITNVRETLSRAAALPHWTLKELLTQVQNFLGATFTISDDTHTINLIPRPNYYAPTHTTPIPLTQVTDTHTTDIDQKDESNGNATTNITYKIDNIDPKLQLPDEVWQNAQVITLLSEGDIRAHFATLTDEEKAASHILYHERVGGRTYAILSYTDTTNNNRTVYDLAEVDQLAPLLHDTTKRDNPTELKIIPALVTPSIPTWQDYTLPWTKATYPRYRVLQPSEGPSARPIFLCSGPTTGQDTLYSVDQAINAGDNTSNNTNTTDTKDIIELAWYGGPDLTSFDFVDTTSPATAPCPISIPYIQDKTTGYYIRPPRLHIKPLLFPQHGPFSLADTHQVSTLGSIGSLLTGAASIDTRVEHQVQFLDDIPLDPTRTLLISGRRYAIHKLEITLTPTGIDPLKTAYLYEIQ